MKISETVFELMPAISLVVCIYRQRDLLKRLLQESHGCYDELLVVHDGPENEPQDNIPTNGSIERKLSLYENSQLGIDFADPVRRVDATKFWKEKTGAATGGSVYELVQNYGGHFFEGPRSFTHECQWPCLWSRCANDWILLLDGDEFPSLELKAWLKQFRTIADSDSSSGYRCIWPLWDGKRAVSKKYPRSRLFLINRKRIRYFAMGENRPVPDGYFKDLDLILHHQPKRKSYGLHNILVREQAYLWRNCIAHSLLGKPTDLNCWRWTTETWPLGWEQIRQRPLWTAFKRLVKGTWYGLRDQWTMERKLFLLAALAGPIHHVLICLQFWKLRRRKSKGN